MLEIQCKVTIKTDSFTKVVLERYKDKAKILYIEPKREEILGLFLVRESLIFQNCVKETSAKMKEMRMSSGFYLF